MNRYCQAVKISERYCELKNTYLWYRTSHHGRVFQMFIVSIVSQSLGLFGHNVFLKLHSRYKLPTLPEPGPLEPLPDADLRTSRVFAEASSQYPSGSQKR